MAFAIIHGLPPASENATVRPSSSFVRTLPFLIFYRVVAKGSVCLVIITCSFTLYIKLFWDAEPFFFSRKPYETVKCPCSFSGLPTDFLSPKVPFFSPVSFYSTAVHGWYRLDKATLRASTSFQKCFPLFQEVSLSILSALYRTSQALPAHHA